MPGKSIIWEMFLYLLNAGNFMKKIFIFLFFVFFFLNVFSNANIKVDIKTNLNVSVQNFSVSEPVQNVLQTDFYLKNNGNTVTIVKPVLHILSENEEKTVFLPEKLIELNDIQKISAFVDKSFFSDSSVSLLLTVDYFNENKTISKKLNYSENFSMKPVFFDETGSMLFSVVKHPSGLKENVVSGSLSIANRTDEIQEMFIFAPQNQDIFFSTQTTVQPRARKIVNFFVKIPANSEKLEILALSNSKKHSFTVQIEPKLAFASGVLWFKQRTVLLFLLNLLNSIFLFNFF